MGPRELLREISYRFPDKAYLNIRYFLAFKRFPDWKNPKTYNEKLQWLKLYNRDPFHHILVDKAAVKDYAAKTLGPEYVIPTLGIWEKPEDIDYDALPEKFVLKCTHDSGSVAVCTDKKTFDRASAGEMLAKGLATDYYRRYREWPYKDVPRRIIAEAFLETEDGSVPDDYKVMCFGGVPKLIILHRGRFGDHTMDFYDTDWNMTDITRVGQARSKTPVPAPAELEEMLALSARLSQGMPHVRVDWYIVHGGGNNLSGLYLGEITFFNNSGFGPFQRREDDLLLGSWIDLDLAKR